MSIHLVGPGGYITQELLVRSFARLRYSAELHCWRFPRWHAALRLLPQRGRRLKQSLIRRRFDKALRSAVKASSSASDLLLVIMPSQPRARTFDLLAEWRGQIATWAIDSTTRYPDQNGLLTIANIALFTDGGDVKTSNGVWQPVGYDPELMSAAGKLAKQIDILFIGNCAGAAYETRRWYLETLRASRLCRLFNVAFVGSSGRPGENRSMKMSGDIGWLGRYLPMSHLAEAIGRSRVCVNIHQDDGIQPLNPMFHGICAARSCEAAENRAYFSQWMTEGRDFLGIQKSNFVQQLEALLGDAAKRRRLGSSGHQASQDGSIDRQIRSLFSSSLFVA